MITLWKIRREWLPEQLAQRVLDISIFQFCHSDDVSSSKLVDYQIRLCRRASKTSCAAVVGLSFVGRGYEEKYLLSFTSPSCHIESAVKFSLLR